MARLKDEKRRTLSSRTWLERQISDPYVARAKREGFRSRAAYKLAEIDDKYRLLKPGARVVDLGAAPGGWSEIAARRVGAGRAGGRARYSRHEADRRRRIPQARFSRRHRAGSASRRCSAARPTSCSPTWRPTPPATGRPIISASWRSPKRRRISPARCSARAAAFSAKCLQGGTEAALLAELKRDFASVKHVKPPASRSNSAELYLLARGFRARETSPA